MVISMTSTSGSKLGGVESETWSVSQILEKPCVHSRGYSFDPIFMKLCQDVNLYNFQVRFETVS